LDLPELAKNITLNMNNNEELSNEQKNNRVYDYIFMCFFLGNDFMPHFPSINIRTGGVDKMISAYKATVGKTRHVITDGKKIFWKQLRLMVEFLKNMEEDKFNDWMDEEYEAFQPTFIDTLRYKISRMSKWQLMLLWVGTMIVEVGLTMLAIYLYTCFN
jgi:5'-3' exonuclease